MLTGRHRAIASLLLCPALLGVACLSSGPTGSARGDLSNYTPVAITANITLPPEWTATPAETATPIPGWRLFEGRSVTVWLPESFIGGDPGQDLNAMLDQLRLLGGRFAESADKLQADPGSFLLWVFDSAPTASGAVTNMTVVKEEVPRDVTMQEYLDAVQGLFPPEMRIVHSGTMSLPRYPEAAQMVLETEVQGLALKEVAYLVKYGSTMWAVTYATGAQDYDALLPTFEQSIVSLTVQP
jgi:hypothetical protein